jgi:site-specific DNA recombinase
VLDRSRDKTAELAARAFELSQTVTNTWTSADLVSKRRILEIVCLNSLLDGERFVFSLRRPLDALTDGSSPRKRG